MAEQQTIRDDTFVELTYRIIDQQSGHVLTEVEFPLGYVQGRNTVLAPQVMRELEGRSAGETISVPIDCTDLFGPRDESLVITDRIENVPQEYHEVGTQILMENKKGEAKSFYVTRVDDQTLTIDGNHPLCERQVLFELSILSVRAATQAEIEAGGKLDPGPNLEGLQARPL
jgi:FKBP-type peptidyl-prolyl cis-trans isomerase SlyD